MRRFSFVGLSGFLLATLLAAGSGCGNDNKGKTEIPKDMIELPKEGPVPAGGKKPKVPPPPTKETGT